MPQVSISSSKQKSLTCSIVTGVLMVLLKPVFTMKAETTFLGGLFGAILFFFLLIFYGNKLAEKGGNGQLGWTHVIFMETIALTASYIIHPVCTTTCILFSLPVIVYIKWAESELSNTVTSDRKGK